MLRPWLHNPCMSSDNLDQAEKRAAHERVEAAIKARYPQAADRPWAYFEERYPEITAQVAYNWKVRGFPKNVVTRQKLVEFLGLRSLEEFNSLLSGSVATGLPLEQGKESAFQMWSLPAVKGDQLSITRHDNNHEDVKGLELMKVTATADIDPSRDKAVTVQAEIAGMRPGDIIIMRPKPPHPVPLTFNVVIVQTAAGDTCFLMEYDRDQIERGGLKVISYAVGHMSATPSPRGVII